MPRKKKPAAQGATPETGITTETGATTSVAEVEAPTVAEAKPIAEAGIKADDKPAPVELPAWIDGPPTGDAYGPDNPQAKNWGDPYKSIFSAPTFELGENRRYRQRVFTFKEKPAPEVLAKLKEHGFTYRAAEKAWTVNANPETRKLTDELARDWAGPDYIRGMEL